MFNRIPSDVVEIVIVYSRSYDLYREMTDIVVKFNDEYVKARVRDKLTEKRVDEYDIIYLLNGDCNREYDKPWILSTKYIPEYSYNHVYRRDTRRLRSDIPYIICYNGFRSYKFMCIDVKGCPGYLYSIGNYRVYESGLRIIDNETINILEL